MHRVLPILAIASIVLGALAAILLNGPFLIIGPAVFGLVVCVFLFLTRQPAAIILGAAAALTLLLALLGGIGGITTEEGGVYFGITLEFAAAFLVTGLALTAGGVLASRWDDMDPDWVGYVGAGVLFLAAVFAFAFTDQLGNLGTWAWVIGALMLVALWPAVVLLRGDGGEGHVHAHDA